MLPGWLKLSPHYRVDGSHGSPLAALLKVKIPFNIHTWSVFFNCILFTLQTSPGLEVMTSVKATAPLTVHLNELCCNFRPTHFASSVCQHNACVWHSVETGADQTGVLMLSLRRGGRSQRIQQKKKKKVQLA